MELGTTHKNEWNEREESTALTCTSDRDSTDSCLKNELEFAEQKSGDPSNRFGENPSMKGILQVSNDTVPIAICEGVANYPPLNSATSN